jgi:hypothetical protein
MQTTNIDIRELVFERLTLLFGPPAPETAHALAEEYARVLKRFPRETLRHAVDCLAETHKYRRWPSVAELVTACRDARPQYATVPPARIADRRLLVAQTLRSKLGQQALKAGYGHSVRLFVEDHGRPPNPAQFQQMAAASKRAQRMAEKELVTGTGATARLKAMWQAMGARRRIEAGVSGMKKADAQLASPIGQRVASPMDAEAEKRRGWRQLGILVVGVEEPRLTWVERKLLEDLGNRLYGNRN